MRSKASIKGHPIHPMLIAFPVAFLVGALVCDLVGLLWASEAWWVFGGWLALAGIGTGLLAAVPGVIDYIYTVPPESSAKKRATWHMSVNVAAIALFAIGWIVRGGAGATEPLLIVVLLEIGGAAMLAMGGWMGGTLVYRNLIAVDHRYARAGKWNEQTFQPTAEAVGSGRAETEGSRGVLKVAGARELEVNQMKLLRIGEKRVVLARTEEGYVAFDDKCAHRGGSLAGGVMICGQVQCLWHGSQFDVRSGEVRAGPAEKPISTYQIEERDGAIHLHL